MKGKVSSIFWGILFILAGGALLADRVGWIDFSLFSTNTWVYLFAAAGLIFLVGYFISGFRRWGLLFPALILAAISLTIWMGDRGLTGSYVGMPVLLAVAIPFYVGFLLDRKAWGLLIPAWVMTVIAIVTLLADSVQGNLIGGLFLLAVAAPFLVVYLLNRSRWWALIPSWTLFVLGVVTLLTDHINGNLIGAMVMYGIALPFLVVYLRNRAQRWALIPAAAMAFFGTIPLLDSVVGGDWMGVAVMLLFAAVFYFVYFRWNTNWWALIPAGIFTSIAVVVFLGILLPADNQSLQGMFTGLLLLGFGLTFGALWLLRDKQPTAWARYPAIGLFVAALLAFIFGSNLKAQGIRMGGDLATLKRACILAAPLGLKIFYQMHTGGVFETIASAANAIDEIGEPNFAVLPEPSNLLMAREKFSVDMLAPLKGRIGGVHVQTIEIHPDAQQSLKLLDGTKVNFERVDYDQNKQLDFPVFFQALRHVGFEGYVNELEPCPGAEKLEVTVAKAAKFLGKLMNN